MATMADVGPGVDGFHWELAKPEDLPTIPLLSLISFKLKPNTNLRDVSKAPGKLWKAAMDYIYTIPGCRSFEWGENMGNNDDIVVFVQWDTAQSWQRFEKSFGLGLILGILETRLSDKTLKIPEVVSGGFSGSDGIVEKMTLSFNLEMLQGPRDAFESWFKVLLDSVGGGDLLRMTSGWLEQGVSNFLQPSPEQISEAQRPAVFTAIFVWDRAKYNSRISELLEERLKSQGPLGIELTVSRAATTLIQEIKDETSAIQPLRPLATSLSSLLDIHPLRIYCEDHGSGNAYGALDSLASQSIEDARHGARLYPSPIGRFLPQGKLCQMDLRLVVPKEHPLPQDFRTDEVCEVIWLSFHPGLLLPPNPPEFPPAFIRQFLLTLKDKGEGQVLWGRDMEDVNAAAIIFVWKASLQRAVGFQELHLEMDAWASSTGHLAQAPKYQVFPKQEKSNLIQRKYLELSSIFVPENEVNEQLFLNAILEFKWTTSLAGRAVAGIPQACNFLTGAWALDGNPRKEIGSSLRGYVTAMAWESPEARTEWYEDFTSISNSYERLGHHIDALRLLTVGPANSRFLAVQGYI